MASRKYNNLIDKKLGSVIKSSDRITQACIIVTVITAIICIVKIIFTLSNVEYDNPPTYSTDYTYYDYMVFHLLVGEIVTSLVLIAVEIFVCKIALYLSSLAEILLKSTSVNDCAKEAESSYAQWICPDCGKTNEGYVGTCGCGKVKPN